MSDCLFCKIIDGEIPSFKIYEDQYTLAFLDISGDFLGHTLVVPKQHHVSMLDCPPDVCASVMQTVQKIAQHFVQCCGIDGVNILSNCGSAAEQQIMHLHVHIIPRKKEDKFSIYSTGPKHEFDLEEIKNKLKIN